MANFYGQFIGFGAGGEAAALTYYGSQYQFAHGGQQAGPSGYDTIDRQSYTSDSTAGDWHDLAVAMWYGTGHSSGTHGFCAGSSGQATTINKYQQLAQVAGADHGDLYSGTGSAMPASDMANQYGYAQCGYRLPNTTATTKFAFASNTTGSSAGDVSIYRIGGGGASSETHGYAHGGATANPSANVIDRFSFASEGTSEDWGNLTAGRGTRHGASSETHGFFAGGYSD